MNSSEIRSGQEPVYTLLLRCSQSQIRIPLGGGILLSPIASAHGSYQARIWTRTDNVLGIATPIPRELTIEVAGPGPSLEAALNVAGAIANEYVRQIAFASNAWHGLLNVHLAYESSAHCKDRPYFQNWVDDERGLPRAARTIDQHLIYRVLVGIAQLSEADRPRVMRAITQYSDALQHWKPGSELYALAHLYMGVEAITEIVVRREILKRGTKSKAELARKVMDPLRRPLSLRFADWLYKRKTGRVPPAPLETWVRREVIFRGDVETFKTARDASNKLEHGLAQHDEVHKLAVRCVSTCARYLREAILDLISMSDDDKIRLTTEPYASPANTQGYDRQLLGVISSDEEDLAAPDQMYPSVRWEFDLKDFQIGEDGSHKMRVEQRLTPLLREGAQLRVSRIRFAGPTETKHEDISISNDGKHQPPPDGLIVGRNVPNDSRWVAPVGSFILSCNSVRHLSAFWILRLSGDDMAKTSALSFREIVDRIYALLQKAGVPDELRNQCKDAWEQALRFNDLRFLLADCATQPPGLVPITHWSPDASPVMRRLDELIRARDELVSLAERLVALLDTLLRLPSFGLGG